MKTNKKIFIYIIILISSLLLIIGCKKDNTMYNYECHSYEVSINLTTGYSGYGESTFQLHVTPEKLNQILLMENYTKVEDGWQTTKTCDCEMTN